MVYAHSHFQHFKKTIEKNYFEQRTEEAVANLFSKARKGVNAKRKEIENIEDGFLNEFYGKQNSDSKERFKKDFIKVMDDNELAKTYLKMRPHNQQEFVKIARENIKEEIDAYEASGAGGGKARTDLVGILRGYQNFFGKIADFLDAFNNYNDNFANTLGDKKELATLKRKKDGYRQIAKTINTSDLRSRPGKKSKTILEIVDKMKQVADGKINTITDLGGQGFFNKLFQAMNETVFEMISVDAVRQAFVVINNNDKQNGVVWLGGLNSKKAGVHTTDYIFIYKGLKIGFDVKANRELYGYGKSNVFGVMEFVSKALTRGSDHGLIDAIQGGDELSKLYAYAMVNMFVLNQFDASGIQVEKAEKVNISFLRSKIQVLLQRLVLISLTVSFLDEYIHFFNTDLRKQIIIQMGDKIVFLTEFLDKVLDLMGNMQNNTTNFNDLGFVNFASTSKKIFDTQKIITDSDVESMNNSKLKQYNDLKNTIGGSGLTNFYPSLFSGESEQKMANISRKVLGKKFSISLEFKFDKI